ncbi:zinc finger domain-containing protein [Leucobacter sp. M11]
MSITAEVGFFSQNLEAYGREGQSCSRCGSPIKRAKFMNRSSHFCPVG